MYHSLNSYNKSIYNVESNFNTKLYIRRHAKNMIRKSWYKYDGKFIKKLYEICCSQGHVQELKFLCKKFYYFHNDFIYYAIKTDNDRVLDFYSHEIKQRNMRRYIYHYCLKFDSFKSIKLLHKLHPFNNMILLIILEEKQYNLDLLNWIQKTFKDSIPRLPRYYFKRQSETPQNINVLKWYKSHCIDISLETLQNTCMKSCEEGNLEIIQWLHTCGNIRSETYLVVCCKYGRLNVLKWFVKYYNLNSHHMRWFTISEYNVLLYTSLRYKRYEIVKYLLDTFYLGKINYDLIMDTVSKVDLDIEWVVNTFNFQFKEEHLRLLVYPTKNGSKNGYTKAKWYLKKFEKDTLYYNTLIFFYQFL